MVILCDEYILRNVRRDANFFKMGIKNMKHKQKFLLMTSHEHQQLCIGDNVVKPSDKACIVCF